MFAGAVGLDCVRSARSRIIDRIGHPFARSIRHLHHTAGHRFADARILHGACRATHRCRIASGELGSLALRHLRRHVHAGCNACCETNHRFHFAAIPRHFEMQLEIRQAMRSGLRCCQLGPSKQQCDPTRPSYARRSTIRRNVVKSMPGPDERNAATAATLTP